MKKLLLILYHIGLYLVSYILIMFATSKFLGAQFRVRNYVSYTPLQDLSDMHLAWGFFGRSYNYNLFLGIIEFAAAVLILFKKTRLIGLLIAAGIYTNIVLIDYEYGVKEALAHATVEYIIVLLLLIPYLKDLKKFFWDMGGKFIDSATVLNKFIAIYLPIAFIFICTFLGFKTLKDFLATEDKFIGAYNISAFTLNDEKVELGQGKYTKQPMLFFEFANGFVLSANDNLYKGNYKIRKDSIFINFDRNYRNIKSLTATISSNKQTLKGFADNKQPFEFSIERVKK